MSNLWNIAPTILKDRWVQFVCKRSPVRRFSLADTAFGNNQIIQKKVSVQFCRFRALLRWLCVWRMCTISNVIKNFPLLWTIDDCIRQKCTMTCINFLCSSYHQSGKQKCCNISILLEPAASHEYSFHFHRGLFGGKSYEMLKKHCQKCLIV